MSEHTTKDQLHVWLAKTGIEPDQVVEVHMTSDTIHGLPVPMMEVVHRAKDPDGDNFSSHGGSTNEMHAALNRTWVPLPPLDGRTPGE